MAKDEFLLRLKRVEDERTQLREAIGVDDPFMNRSRDIDVENGINNLEKIGFKHLIEELRSLDP